MSQVKFIGVDKRMAGLSGPQGDPHNDMKTITVTMMVVDDNGAPASLPVKVTSGRSEGSVLFFDSDFQPLYPGGDADPWIHVESWKNGEVLLYLCAPMPIIFNLIAVVEKPPSGTNQTTLVFFDFDANLANPPFPLPGLALPGGQFDIPPWSKLSYGTSANVQVTPQMVQFRTAATVCNTELLNTGGPELLNSNFVVPYQALLTGGRLNQLAYLLDNGVNAFTSPTLRFPAFGQALVMPDPYKSAQYPAPQWPYGTVTRLTTSDIWPGMTLTLTLVDGVQQGDTYDIYLYLNGYDKYGNFIPAAPPHVYTITAPAGAKPNQTVSYTISKEDLLGYGRKNAYEWGYMWADCLINRSAWTFPWGPIMIDFTYP